jgi:hypothetical protein
MSTLCCIPGRSDLRRLARQSLGLLPSIESERGGENDSTMAPVRSRRTGQLVKVSISTSRSEVTNEGGYGIFADLQNVDSLPLTRPSPIFRSRSAP